MIGIMRLLDLFADKLRDGLDVPVEKYWLLEPPSVPLCLIRPVRSEAENASTGNIGAALSGGTYFLRHWLEVRIEVPWSGRADTIQKADAINNAVIALLRDNRDIVDSTGRATNGRYEGTRWNYEQRQGSGDTTIALIGEIELSWRVGGP